MTDLKVKNKCETSSQNVKLFLRHSIVHFRAFRSCFSIASAF